MTKTCIVDHACRFWLLHDTVRLKAVPKIELFEKRMGTRNSVVLKSITFTREITRTVKLCSPFLGMVCGYEG